MLRNKGKTEGNNYSNVIHAILSGISKLSQVSGIPEGRIVNRGVGGMRLPKCFYVQNDKGVLGGTERAFMSTTTSRDVALYYIGGREMATIFSIQVSAVSKGASISHLSQFPGEEEVLMPPGSFLEVVGAPQVVTLDDGTTSVLEIPMQISCPKMVTIEETRASRRTGLRAMVEHALLEIHRDLEALSKEERVARRAEGDVFCSFAEGKEDTTVAEPTREPSLHNAGLLPEIERECREWMERAIASRDPAIFNNDEHYQRVVREASELKRLALNKVQVWLEDPNVNAGAEKNMTLAEADRHAIGCGSGRGARPRTRCALPRLFRPWPRGGLERACAASWRRTLAPRRCGCAAIRAWWSPPPTRCWTRAPARPCSCGRRRWATRARLACSPTPGPGPTLSTNGARRRSCTLRARANGRLRCFWRGSAARTPGLPTRMALNRHGSRR